MEAPAHLLSLKVMRVSRPTLASAWEPFFSSDPSFSAHSTLSITSLQGSTPLTGNPKTLRDLSTTQLLTLPSSFGAIQLGETFSSCLCLSNETALTIEGVYLKVEMQTATNKLVVAELGGLEAPVKLGPSEMVETVVHHEIKELGQHVLGCTVTYRLPPSVRIAPAPSEDPSDPRLQIFRKYYKFPVTNPLSVKTKVHTPKAPTALLSKTEREKIFLEVHVQNLTPEPLWFERMKFECVDGWQVEDTNFINGESIFSGSSSLIQPQDLRQYVYILTPSFIPSFPVVHGPGTIIALGRLDISWRSALGEPGRLLTSMLSRRIPLTQPQVPASALPPHLQRPIPHRPGSPSLPGSRPGSPFNKPRQPSTPRPQSRPQSPSPSSRPDFEVDLTVLSLPHAEIFLERPFTIKFSLAVSGALRSGQRSVVLAVQHVQPPKPIAVATQQALTEPFSPKLMSGMETPSPTLTPRRGNFNFGFSDLVAVNGGLAESPDIVSTENPLSGLSTPKRALLPAPFSEHRQQEISNEERRVEFVGTSSLTLPPIILEPMEGDIGKGEGRTEFELTYIPVKDGFATVGGLRAVLLEEKVDDIVMRGNHPQESGEAKVLREWDVVGEIWVQA